MQLAVVISDVGLPMLPTTTLADCPDLDVICIPGGPGMNELLEDDEVLDFVRRQGAQAQYVTSVCTGALVLGAAGLLQGYKQPPIGRRWNSSRLSARRRSRRGSASTATGSPAAA